MDLEAGVIGLDVVWCGDCYVDAQAATALSAHLLDSAFITSSTRMTGADNASTAHHSDQQRPVTPASKQAVRTGWGTERDAG